jgi:uncharacterized membrane protein YoaK (UPF0700 family)
VVVPSGFLATRNATALSHPAGVAKKRTGNRPDHDSAATAFGSTKNREVESLRRAFLLFAVWLAYYRGAVLAGGAAVRFGTFAAALPLAGLAVAIALELRTPTEASS